MADSFFPKVKKSITDFLYEEEGNIPRNKLLTLGFTQDKQVSSTLQIGIKIPEFFLREITSHVSQHDNINIFCHRMLQGYFSNTVSTIL